MGLDGMGEPASLLQKLITTCTSSSAEDDQKTNQDRSELKH